MRGKRGFDVLKGLIANDPSERVRERAISTLGGSKEPEAVDLLIATARKDPSARMRMQALSALNRHTGAKVLEYTQRSHRERSRPSGETARGKLPAIDA